MYTLLLLCSTSYHLKLKVNVAHAVWPGLLVSTITVSRMFVLSLGRFLVVGGFFLGKF